MIGEALDGTAEDVRVATKAVPRGPGPPRALWGQIEESLRSLRTEAIGLDRLPPSPPAPARRRVPDGL